MVELNPAVRPLALPAAQRQRRDAWVIIPNRSAAVLLQRIRLKREGVEVLTAASEFHAFDRLDVIFESQGLDRRFPVVEAVVFGRWREFEMLGGDVDDASIGVADVVTARRAVIVEVRTDPAFGIDQALQRAFELDRLSGLNRDFLRKIAVFRPTHDDDAIFARRELLGEMAVLAVILVHTAMCAPFRAEIELRGLFIERRKVRFARHGLAGFVSDGETDGGGGVHKEFFFTWSLA